MAYFIFSKDLDNSDGTLYKFAENQSDLNNLNIIQSDYKIIEDSQSNFDLVKYGNKIPIKYNGDTIIYSDQIISFMDKQQLQTYVNSFKDTIKDFIKSNSNHSLFNQWNNYYNQLNSLNLDNITYPLNQSLEQYFKDQNKISLNPLQIP
jgi:hypothetical protein